VVRYDVGTRPRDEGDAPAAIAWLIRSSHLMRPDQLPQLADEAARMMGAVSCTLYVISRDQRSLVPLSPVEPDQEAVTVDGTLAGRAFRMIELVPSTGSPPRLWAPLLDGTERLGVMDVRLESAGDAAEFDEPVALLAGAVAELLVSKGQYTDAYERARRSLPMTVASELLWQQLPPLTFATDRVAVTAQLEPWNEVGGDAFDYSTDGDLLQFAVFDGMGHGLGAAMLTSVALAAYRNARRTGVELPDIVAVIDSMIADSFGPDSFVTGILGQLDVATGELTMCTAGHPAPVLIRAGRIVGEVSSVPGPPFGLASGDVEVSRVSLEPADRLLLFSDGVIEARSSDGEFFGIDRLLDLLRREEAAGFPPPETLRRLILAVLAHQRGELQDDATVMLVEWQADTQALVL
jgi:hypothetical protein